MKNVVKQSMSDFYMTGAGMTMKINEKLMSLLEHKFKK